MAYICIYNVDYLGTTLLVRMICVECICVCLCSDYLYFQIIIKHFLISSIFFTTDRTGNSLGISGLNLTGKFDLKDLNAYHNIIFIYCLVILKYSFIIVSKWIWLLQYIFDWWLLKNSAFYLSVIYLFSPKCSENVF